MSATRTAARKSAARAVRVAGGAVIWALLGVWIAGLVHDAEGERDARAIAAARDWLTGRRMPVRVAFPRPVEVEVGDGVFFDDGAGAVTLIGDVSELLEGGDALTARRAVVREARCLIAPSGRDGLDTASRVTSVSTPQTAAWVKRTLLPPERLSWIATEWNATLLRHREEVFEAISPVLQDLVGDFEAILLEDLPPAIDRHREELTAIFREFQGSVLEREFRPLLEDELFPVLLARARPTLDAIGREILERLPVWTLTWRLLYQNLPLTADDHVQREWNRFVETEVVPILRQHIDDALGALQDVAAETATNPNVAAALRRSVAALLGNRELQHRTRLIFQEIILDNPRFQDAMWERWQSPEMAAALEKLAVFIAPLLRRFGDEVLGTRDGSVTPEFARVLRTQILEKDRHWILIERGDEEGAPLERDHRFEAGIASEE